MIIHAADKAGIPIPRDTEVGGRSAPKPSPACATPVMDGMKVFTRNDKALKAQRNVMEFLLINPSASAWCRTKIWDRWSRLK